MVKALSEESDVRMPSFFGYMGVLDRDPVPIFVLLTLVSL